MVLAISDAMPDPRGGTHPPIQGEAPPDFPEPDRKLRFAVDEGELETVPTTLAKTTAEVGVRGGGVRGVGV